MTHGTPAPFPTDPAADAPPKLDTVAAADAVREDLARLRQELDEQTEMASDLLEEIATLHRIGQLMAGGLSMQELLDAVLGLACEALEAPVAVHLVPDGFQWTLRNARGLGERPWPAVARGDAEGIFQYAQETRRSVIVNDFEADARMSSRFCEQLGATAIVCAPMWGEHELIGMLAVLDRAPGRGFTAGNAKLLTSVASQFGNAMENRRLHEEEIEQRKLAQQIEIARSIQEKLLPLAPPAFQGAEIAGSSVPAREVGGDYYDFMLLDENRLAVVVGDVAGKGIPAAMLMTLTKGVFTALVSTKLTPAQILGRVNRSLSLERISDRFVTLVFYVFDRRDRTATVANAGHEPLLWIHGSTGNVDLISNDRLPLGISPEEPYSQQVLQLDAGDTLFAFTDGFTEAMDLRRRPWGMDRLLDTVLAHRRLRPASLLEATVREVRLYVGEAPVADDMTAAVLRVT